MFARLSRLASSSSSSSTSYQDESLREQVSLQELNDLLEVLADVFPDHEVALLRELLLDASSESRLHVAANALVQSPQRFAQKQPRLHPGCVEDWEKFRSTKYRKTVEKLLVVEYQRLSKSTIRTILTENNHDYVRSREALSDITAKSWRFSITAWISRRKAPPPQLRLDVTKKSTGCIRLDDEIYALGRSEREVQSLRDEKIAKSVNEDEHARAHALLECECCFGDYTWEDMTVCTEGHFFCRECLDRSVKEALFGQGNCLLREKGSVRCVSSVATPACEGFVASTLLPHALSAETLEKVEQRFARDDLQNSGLHLVRCPACSYATEDNSSSARLRPRAIGVIALLALSAIRFCAQLPYQTLATALHLSIFLLSYRAWADLCRIPTHAGTIRAWASDAMTRVRRKHTGVRQVFKCENPRCGMASCVDCGKPWAAFHDCRSEALDNQRLYVERAMSEAIKRTCPQCRTSFVKSDGCNKLRCPCGYEMCYMCRADVRGTGYLHFCQHFRVEPGTLCNECDQCNLYETEDEQAVAAAAARRAAAEWAASRSDARPGVTQYTVPSDRTDFPPNRTAWPSAVEQHMESVIEFAFEW